MRARILLFALCLIGAWTTPCAYAGVNDRSGCITDFDPGTDYFPHKARITRAQGLRLSYHKSYKLLEVAAPGTDLAPIRYLLVLCGAPRPAGHESALRVSIPVRRVVALSTTQLPHLDLLHKLDSLVGASDLERITTPTVRARVDSGAVAETGRNGSLDLETILDLTPDLVMGVYTPRAPPPAYARLRAAGVPVVLNGEYLEPTLLGRAEWIKFSAAFFNQDGQAQELFAAIEARYLSYAALTADPGPSPRPSAFSASPYQGTWYVAGGNSYPARLITTAGGEYLWEGDSAQGGQGSLALSFEAVLDRAMDADFWFVSSSDWKTRAQMVAGDRRLGLFQALRNGHVYGNDAQVNAHGGNAWWEAGIMEPDQLLADMIKVLHPRLLPGHRLKYYRRLP